MLPPKNASKYNILMLAFGLDARNLVIFSIILFVSIPPLPLNDSARKSENVYSPLVINPVACATMLLFSTPAVCPPGSRFIFILKEMPKISGLVSGDDVL